MDWLSKEVLYPCKERASGGTTRMFTMSSEGFLYLPFYNAVKCFGKYCSGNCTADVGCGSKYGEQRGVDFFR